MVKNFSAIALVILLTLSSSVVGGDKDKPSKYEYLDLFSKALDIIEKQYYREVSIQKLMEGAIRGLLETLDPHSSYLDEESLEKMKKETSGKFGGLGVEVTAKDGVILVITPFEGTPAFNAGIKSGDKIVEIEHESILGIGLDEAVKKMHGKPGTKITIGVIRKGSEKMEQISLRREIIKVKPVKSQLLEKKYAYIRLSQFQAESSKHVQRHLKKLSQQAKGLQGIVLDLRSNPGGLLGEAVKVASIFLNDGIVVSTEARYSKQKEVRMVLKGGFKNTKTPLVVLINGASASASEIVAGALQDHKRAIIMGGASFGKGSVQTIIDLDKKRGLKLTIQQYMTPNGTKIQAKGIEPDINIVEFKANWDEQIANDPVYIREQDLRNHLSATIETVEEKKLRIKREKMLRIKRRDQFKKAQQEKNGKNKKREKDQLVTRLNPRSDFQVHSAINCLKSFDFYRQFNSSGKM